MTESSGQICVESRPYLALLICNAESSGHEIVCSSPSHTVNPSSGDWVVKIFAMVVVGLVMVVVGLVMVVVGFDVVDVAFDVVVVVILKSNELEIV